MGEPQRLAEVVKALPPDIEAQTLDFVQFLLNKRKTEGPRKGRPLRREWASGLYGKGRGMWKRKNTQKYVAAVREDRQ